MRILSFLIAMLFATSAYAVTDVLEPSDLDPVNQALQELRQIQQDIIKRNDEQDVRLDALEKDPGGGDPGNGGGDPPDPNDPNPSAGMVENEWRHYGTPITALWSLVDPPLDDLTRGVTGIRATWTQFAGAAFNWPYWTRAAGGHRATGYGRGYRGNILTGEVEWFTPDYRLNDPRMPASKCPYPSELGEKYGAAANHWYGGIVSAGKEVVLFPDVPYDCKGPGNREPAYVWKIQENGDWKRLVKMRPHLDAVAAATLPDDKILTVSRYFSGVFDATVGDWIPFRRGTKDYESTSSYAELGAYGNLYPGGTYEDGSLRFFHGGYHKNIYEIKISKDDDGVWNLGWPKKIVEKAGPWYTGGVVYLPEPWNAIMAWGGGKKAAFYLLDEDPVKKVIAEWPDFREPPEPNPGMHLHAGLMQWVPQWGTVATWGPHHTDGFTLWKPPADLNSISDEAPPPPEEIQPLFDRAKSGEVTIIPAGHYKAGIIRTDGATIQCEPETYIKGTVKGQGGFVVEANNVIIDGCNISSGSNRSLNAAVWGGGGSHNLTLRNVTLHDSFNGLITCKSCVGTTTVENSRILRNGGSGRGPGHGIYNTQSSSQSRMVIKNTVFEGTQNTGHHLKWRSGFAEIVDNTFLPANGNYSRVLDDTAGSQAVITGNTIVHSKPPALNSEAFCLGCERYVNGAHDVSSIVFTGNKISCNGLSRFIRVHPSAAEYNLTSEMVANDNEISGSCGTLVDFN